MKNICFHCIGDDYIEHTNKDFILATCDFCGHSSVNCLTSEKLSELLKPIIKQYAAVEEFMSTEHMKDLAGNGDFIWDKMRFDWELFPEIDSDYLENLFNEMFFDRDEPQLFLSSYVENEYDFYGINDEVTDELERDWSDFCDEIIHTNRFFPERSVNLDTLSGILVFLENTLSVGENLFRGRIADTKEGYSIDDMGPPPAEKSKSGRANPFGIPYFYLASTMDTAIAEVRPMILDTVSIGSFQLIETLRIIDLAGRKSFSPFQLGYRISDYLKYYGFLKILSRELSKPIHPNKSDLEYLPLQYLCEFIKNLGYEGVSYKSSIGDGYNLAVFSNEKFSGNSVTNVEITKINYLHNEI